MKNIVTILIFSWLGISIPCFSQNTSASVQELLQLWDNQSAEVSTLKTDTSGFQQALTMLNWIPDNQTRHNNYDRAINLAQQEAAYYNNDLGLSINGNYLENFDPSVSDFSDNLIYQRRFQGGINWDVLNNGYVENKNKAEQQQVKAEILSILNTKKQKEKYYEYRWNTIMRLFNQSKIDITQQRIDHLTELSTAVTQLHYAKYYTKEDWIKLEALTAESKAILNIYETFKEKSNLYADTLVVPIQDIPAPNVKFNIDEIIPDTSKFNDSLNVLYNRLYNLDYHWTNEVSLRSFFRYNYYDLININNANRSFFSAGVSFAIPLPLRTKTGKQLQEAKVLNEIAVIEEEEHSHSRELLNELYEFRYKQKQFIHQVEQHRVLLEEKRQWDAKRKLNIGLFNPVKAHLTLDNLLANELEILDLKQQLYLKLLKLQLRADRANITLTTEPLLLPKFEDDNIQLSKSIYCWSETIAQHSNTFLLEYAKYYDTKYLAIAVSDDTLMDKRIEFAKELLQNQIQPLALIGKNKMLSQNPSFNDFVARLHLDDHKTWSGIHLDIEPHVFEDFDQNESQYMQQLSLLINKAANFTSANEQLLQISIPLHYDLEWIKAILPQVDLVVFMFYENTDLSYLEKKLSPYLAEYKDKLAIAIRTNDFDNKNALMKKAASIQSTTGLKKIYLHDLGSLYKLDQAALERNQE